MSLMRFPASVCFCTACWLSSWLVAQGPGGSFHVQPKLFDGTLLLSTTSDLSERQLVLLKAELQRDNGPHRLILMGKEDVAKQSKLVEKLQELQWNQPTLVVEPKGLELRTLTSQLAELGTGSCIWLDQPSLDELRGADQIAELLRECLSRGALVVLDALHTKTGLMPGVSSQLLPSIQLERVTSFDEDSSQANQSPDRKQLDSIEAPDPVQVNSKLLRLQLAQESWLRIAKREIVNLSESAKYPARLLWPQTASYPEPLEQALPRYATGDMVAALRAWHERQQAAFPDKVIYEPQLNKGALVIVGGGGASPEIWKKFIDLAGGDQARIVVLPTAIEEPSSDDAVEARILGRLGAKEIRVLPQISRAEVSSPKYLENFRWATGVWFGGGRQWRFVDAYWNTPAWDEIKQVVQRGGVIGGSSAGATIQGDLLVRGHPLGNQIMIADGYRRGLGLLAGVAIDQHFKQRNRFDDLAGVVRRFPSVIGIGIDESTALIVEAPRRCSVLGNGSVWLTNGETASSEQPFKEMPSGTQFELSASRPIIK